MAHESLKPLPKRKSPFEWKTKQPKGMIAQGEWERSRGRKQSWKSPSQ